MGFDKKYTHTHSKQATPTIMHKIDLTPAYLLHSRPFRNTSLLIDLFTREHGRICAVARSARGPKSRYQGQLQLFTPLLISWRGTQELKTLGNIELSGMPIQLNQKPLFCGFYLNELMTRLLHKEDSHPILFDHYHHTLLRLEKNEPITTQLRLFEIKLLEELGYGLPLKEIDANTYYFFEPEQGLTPCAPQENAFFGNDLIAIANKQLENDDILHTAKRLTRHAIHHLLDNKPLNSRDFF